MKKMTIITLALTLLLPFTALADPAPFGLELNKSTRQQVLKMYPTRTGTNQYSNGPMYDLETAGIDFEGLQALSVIFSVDDRLLAVLATFYKNDFNRANYLKKTLKIYAQKRYSYRFNLADRYSFGTTPLFVEKRKFIYRKYNGSPQSPKSRFLHGGRSGPLQA